jgi:hypothetical protein
MQRTIGNWHFGNCDLDDEMIIESLIGVCFFAGVVIVLCIPWLGHGEAPAEHPAEHH